MSYTSARVLVLMFSVATVAAGAVKHDQDSAIQRWSSLIGIITAIVGNVLISFALNIQRYAHIRLDREGKKQESWNGKHQDEEQNGGLDRTRDLLPDHISESGSDSADAASQKTYLQSPYWWAGLCLMVLGEAGNFLAYGFAPASIVSPLGVVALISNCVIAPFMLKERFRQRDFWGVLVAIAGAITVVLSAKQSETKLGQHEIWDAISRWEFLLYLFITLVLMGVLIWASSHQYGERTSLVDLSLVGLFGGYTALSTKGIASLLSYTLWRVLTFPITYLLLGILISSAMLQIRYINKALQRFDSTQVIPTQFVLFTISVIIGSAVLYRDFESATADRVLKFVAGCCLTFAGVYLITSHRDQDADNEAIGLEQEQHQDEDEASSLLSRPSKYGTSSAHTPRRQLSAQSSAAEGSPQPDDLSRPALPPTASTPILPAEAQDTDTRPFAGRAVTQHPSLMAPSPRSLGRRSMSRMVPGPLFSPLSSSLSAVVADSLRRGRDTSLVERETGIGRPRLKSSQRSDSSLPIEEPLDPVSRRKSLSAAIGNLFRRKRREDDTDEPDG